MDNNINENILIHSNKFDDYNMVQLLGLFKYGSSFFVRYLFNRFETLVSNDYVPDNMVDKFRRAFVLKKNNTKKFTNTLEIPDEIRKSIENAIVENNYDITYEEIIESINEEIQFPTIKYPIKYIVSTKNDLSHVSTMFQGLYNGNKIEKVFVYDKYVITKRPFVNNNEILELITRCVDNGYLHIDGSYIELSAAGNIFISILTAKYNSNKYFEPAFILFNYVGEKIWISNPFVNRMLQILKDGPVDYFEIANNFGPKNEFEYHFVSKRLQTYIFQNESGKLYSISAKAFHRLADEVIYGILNILIENRCVEEYEEPYKYTYNGIDFVAAHDKKYKLTELGIKLPDVAENATQLLPLNMDTLSTVNEDSHYILLRNYTILYILSENQERGIDIGSLTQKMHEMRFDEEDIYTVTTAIYDLIFSGFHIRLNAFNIELYNTRFYADVYLKYMEKNKQVIFKGSKLLKDKSTLYRNFMFTDKKYLTLINIAHLSKDSRRRINDRDHLLKVLLCEMMNNNGINAECFFAEDEPDLVAEFNGYRVIIDISSCRDDKRIIINVNKMFEWHNDLKSNWNDCYEFKKNKTIIMYITNDVAALKKQNVLENLMNKLHENKMKLYCGFIFSIEDALNVINILHVDPALNILKNSDIRKIPFTIVTGERLYDAE